MLDAWLPAGPKGRFAPFAPSSGPHGTFQNKSAAKSLLVHLSQPAAVESLSASGATTCRRSKN